LICFFKLIKLPLILSSVIAAFCFSAFTAEGAASKSAAKVLAAAGGWIHRPSVRRYCAQGCVLEVRLVQSKQVRNAGYSVSHGFCSARDAALPQPRALARQKFSDRLFQLERACPGMDTPAGQNNNRNTPYLQALRLARPEATLNNLVSHCKRFWRITEKSQFDGDAQGARCTNRRRFMPSGRISRRAALPVKTF
jgi:hypothetical protein